MTSKELKAEYLRIMESRKGGKKALKPSPPPALPAKEQEPLESIYKAMPVCNVSTDSNEQQLAFVEQFLGSLIWQTFDDSKGHNRSLARVYPGGLEETKEHLQQLNKQGAGVFIAVNEMKGHKRANTEVKRVRFLVADFDGVSPIKAFADNPHMIVESSKGKFHCYWHICDCPPEMYRDIEKSIIRKYNSDPAVCDLARVLRVPGFMHQKGKPFMTRLWHVSEHHPLTLDEALRIFPPEPVKKFNAPKYYPEDNAPFKGMYGTSKGGRNVWLTRRIGGMIKAGRSWDYIEQEAMREASSCSPPLDERETMSVLNSMRRYL